MVIVEINHWEKLFHHIKPQPNLILSFATAQNKEKQINKKLIQKLTLYIILESTGQQPHQLTIKEAGLSLLRKSFPWKCIWLE